jgi:DNA-binding NtrC family response regulator
LPLEELIERGSFRRDLYARLAAFEHHLLPLRDRREDIGALIAALLRSSDIQSGTELRLRPEAARALMSYSWPLNVRELKQCLATSSVLATDQTITLDALPNAVRSALDAESEATLSESELSPEQLQLRDELVQRLRETGGNVSEVARAMSKARQQVQRWLRRFGLDPQRYKR